MHFSLKTGPLFERALQQQSSEGGSCRTKWRIRQRADETPSLHLRKSASAKQSKTLHGTGAGRDGLTESRYQSPIAFPCSLDTQPRARLRLLLRCSWCYLSQCQPVLLRHIVVVYPLSPASTRADPDYVVSHPLSMQRGKPLIDDSSGVCSQPSVRCQDVRNGEM